MVLAGIFMAAMPVWSVQVLSLIVVYAIMAAFGRVAYAPAYIAAGTGVLLAASVQLVFHWDKVVVLRFGRFHKVKDAGNYFPPAP